VQATGSHCRSFNSISSILDELYEFKEKEEKRQNLFAMLTRNVEQAVKKTRKKETVQLLELEAAGKADYYRQCGELILMNLKDIPVRSREVELENIFSEQGGMINISLDPRLSPPLNAQRYFRKYRKARQGEKIISENLEQTRQEISYLESVLFSLQKADLQTLREIRDELEETGYLTVPQKPRYPKQAATFNPLKFISSRGEEIFVGRNNRQNEYLVQRFATGTELWFHVKDLPGAHVIVRPGVPHEKTIHEAALLAAYFSRGAHSSNVPVDYTQIKNVRRLPGGKPGMVTYTNYKTLYVTPDEQNLRPLLAQHKA
jgi:predicted ribosome quality control (RQC) complex YloA/Tae2 family protein